MAATTRCRSPTIASGPEGSGGEGAAKPEPQPPSRALAEPRSWYAWYVVGVLTLANVSGFIDRQILSLLIPPIKRDLGITDTQMSLLIGLSFAFFYSVMGLPIARLADRASRRNIIGIGVAAWSLFTMLSGTAHTYARLFLFRMGVGVGEATLAAPAVSMLSDYFPRDRLARALSVYSLGVFLGSGLAYFIGGAIVGLVEARDTWHWPVVGEIRPWQSVFFFVGAPGLLISALFLTVREPRRRSPTAGGKGVPLATVVAYVRDNAATFATHAFGFATFATVNYGIAAWLATFFVRTHGWSLARAGMVQGMLTMTIGVCGVLAGGWIADRLVARGRPDGTLRVGIIGAVGMLVSASAYPLMPTAGWAVAWLAVVNFFAAFPWGAASAAAAEMVPPELRAQGAALYFFVLSLVSAALGPTAVAIVTDFVFRDELALRYSLVVVNVLGMSLAMVLLAIGLPAFRRTLDYRERWRAPGATSQAEGRRADS